MADIVEIRIYRISPGKREKFLDIFTSKVVPEQRRVGMKVLGPFLSDDDPDNTISQRWEPKDTFVWSRSFPDMASRKTMKAAFYEGDLWVNELKDQIMSLIEEMDVVLVEDTRGLPDAWHWSPADAETGRTPTHPRD